MKTGIYKIQSKTTGKLYIGSSIDIEQRWRQHLSSLRSSTHGNYKLQGLYIEHGEKDLGFSIIELCTAEERFQREQFWINEFNPEINIVKDIFTHTTKSSKKYANIMLVHSSGRVVTNIDNLSEFCREESLIYENMYELLNNITSSGAELYSGTVCKHWCACSYTRLSLRGGEERIMRAGQG